MRVTQQDWREELNASVEVMRGAGAGDQEGGNHSLKIDVARSNLVTPLGQRWGAWGLPLLFGVHMAKILGFSII